MRPKEMARIARLLLNSNRADFLDKLRLIERTLIRNVSSLNSEVQYLQRQSTIPATIDVNWVSKAHHASITITAMLKHFYCIQRQYTQHVSYDFASASHFLLPVTAYNELQPLKAIAAAVSYEADVMRQLKAVAKQRTLYSWQEFVNMRPEQLKPRLSPTGYAMLEFLRVSMRVSDGIVFSIPIWQNEGLSAKLGPIYCLIAFDSTSNGYTSFNIYMLACRGAVIVSARNLNPPACVPWASGFGSLCVGSSYTSIYHLLIQGQIRAVIDMLVRSLMTDNYATGYGHCQLFTSSQIISRTQAHFRRLQDFAPLVTRYLIPGLIDSTCEVCHVRTPINSHRSQHTRSRLCKTHARQCVCCLQWGRNDQAFEWVTCSRCKGFLCVGHTYSCAPRCLVCVSRPSTRRTITPRT